MEGYEAPPAYDTTVDEPPPAYARVDENPPEYDTTSSPGQLPSYNVVSSQLQIASSPQEEENGTIKPLVTFSNNVGCTIYEIGTVFEQKSYGAKENVWEKLMNTKSELTSFVEIYTITMSLIALTLKSKNNDDKPPQNEIQSLAKQLMNKLPTNSDGQRTLSKDEYTNNLSSILYDIHYEMTNDNPTKQTSAVQETKSSCNDIVLNVSDNQTIVNPSDYNDAADMELEAQERSIRIMSRQRTVNRKKRFRYIWIFLIILCIVVQVTTEWGYIWVIVFVGACGWNLFDQLCRKTSVSSLSRNCPGKHGLTKFSTPQAGYGCDGCKQKPLRGTTMYGCRECNYDLCCSCYGTP